MLDIKWIRDNRDEFDASMAKRGVQKVSETLSKLDEDRRELITLIQQFQQARNAKSKMLATISPRSREFAEIKRDVVHINEKLIELETSLESGDQLQNILNNLPNIPAKEVPYGTDESMNQLIRICGEIKENKNAKQHFEIGEELGLMDFAKSAKMSGSRFVILKGDLAKLERALISFMIDIHTKEFEFFEISPPYMVRPNAMYNSGQLPKFEEDSFQTTNNYRLISTAEVPLVNMVADSIVPREELPIRYVAYSPCFRSEVGAAGKDTKGMIRLHQFGKVELVTITTQEESEIEHEYILNAAEEVLKRLKLPYRVMLLCSGDMGFAASKTYDIEVWMPGQNTYREVSSCSNCTDFQARRMKARYQEFGMKDKLFVHTLNGSGLPIGRTMVAILENYYNEDGSVTIPEVLEPYMDGIKKICSIKN